MSWLNEALQRRGRSLSLSFKELLPAVFSGLLVGVCLPRPGLTFLAWIALIPLLTSLRDGGAGSAVYNGWAAGTAFFGLATYWIYCTCRFAGIPAPIAFIAWAASSLALGSAWALFAALGRWSAEPLPEPLRPLAWAVAWTAVAVVFERWTPRFAVDLLEYTQYRHLALIQLASVFGPHGLGFLIVWINASLSQRQRANAAASLAALAAAWCWGSWTLLQRPLAAPTQRVELLQPNIDQYQKWDERFESRIEENFQELLSRPRPAAPVFVLWPESALPWWLDEGAEIPVASPWSRKEKTRQIVGAITRGPLGHVNAAVLLGPDGRPEQAYAKRELVPFGEYVPFEWTKRFVGLLEQMNGLSAGRPEQPFFQTPLGPVAPSICYEATFPRYARADARRGAAIIANVTNDGWYKATWGPHQHFYTNVFRAVENRVSIVRSGNTGISGVIDPWGVVTARLELNTRGRLDAQVLSRDPFPQRSLHARTGDWFGLVNLILGLALLCARPGLNARARD